MRRLPLAAVLLLACTRGDGVATKRLDEFSARLDALEAKSDKIDGRLKKIEDLIEQATKGPPEPDPDAVYAVPIAGDPYRGPQHAKVTMVEAFEFA